MKVTIERVRPEHIPALARICFEAFGTLQERHHVQRDFDSIETAQMVIGMFAGRPDFAGFAAIDHDGTPLGSNFLGFSDCNGNDEGVAGVGPITVAPAAQGRGVGKLLMQAVMNEASRRGISKVRLIQEAINTTSLSLYTKLGFDWRDGISLIQPAPAPVDDPRMSPVTQEDLPDIDAISRRHYHAPRVKEVEGFLKMGLPGFMLRSNGKALGYFFTSFLGHGFADTPENLAALVCHTARHAPPHFHKTLLPLSENELHRALLARGCTSVKLLNYMSTGEYRPPHGAWMPCIGM